MERILTGKFLVRPVETTKGTTCLLFVGLFEPDNFIHGSKEDEMWVAHIKIMEGGLRFTGSKGGGPSLEDFFEGRTQHPNSWENKENL